MASILFSSAPGILTLSGSGRYELLSAPGNLALSGSGHFVLLLSLTPGILPLSGSAVLNIFGPPPPWNPNLDFVFNSNANPVDGVGRGIGVTTLSGAGRRLEIFIPRSPGVIDLSGRGIIPAWILIASRPGVITLSGGGETLNIPIGDNWIWWSEIGDLVFLDPRASRQDIAVVRRNVAGFAPLEVSGWVFQIKKLGDKVIVYGRNGVTLFTPAQTAWGKRTLRRVGLIAKNALTGTEDIHYFIDSSGVFWSLTADLRLNELDYSEYFASLTTATVMSYDEEEDLVYICDGTLGFVFSPADGLGRGPANITGIGRLAGTLFLTAPSAVVTAPLQITTDIIDFGVRTEKFISSVEVGTDHALGADLQVALDFRRDKISTWTNTGWVTTNAAGVAPFYVSGVEFRVHVRLSAYRHIEIDYLTIRGKVNDLRQTSPEYMRVMR
ncbi:MAG: hypothetical protein DDT19_01898 [Syntrophomonadaceae bacterium]|nr:hypothetical protein [Bacillota bacterium]